MDDAAEYCASQARTGDLDRYLAVLYAPEPLRPGLHALTALDLELAGIVRATREPMLGEMRLVWWRDALAAMDTGRVPAQPILQVLSEEALPRGVRGGSLEPLEDGFWRMLTDDLAAGGSLAAYATGRGGTLFQAMLLLGEPAAHPMAQRAARRLGEAWALAELVREGLPQLDPGLARGIARQALIEVDLARLPRSAAVRPLRALARLIARDLDARPEPAPRRGSLGRQLLLFRGAHART